MDFNYAFQSNVDTSASTEDSNFPLSNLKNTIRSKVFRSTANTVNILFDLKSTEEIDSVVILFHPFDGCKLSQSATITLEGNATNVWTAPAFSQALSFDEDHEIYSLFLASSQSYRYFRLKISDTTNDLGYIEIAKVIITKATQLTQCPDIGFAYKNDDMSKQTRTAFNQVYVDIMPNVRTFEFNYTVLTYADFETLQTIYDRVGSALPICISLDTTESLFDKDRFIIYGHLGGTMNAKNHVFSYFDQPLTITEAF